MSNANTDGAAQEPDQNLIHYQRGEEFGIAGMRQTLHHPGCGADNAGGDRRDVNGISLLSGRQTVGKHLQDHVGNLVRVEVQLESQIGIDMAGLRDLGSDR